jgi:hypothetical protein
MRGRSRRRRSAAAYHRTRGDVNGRQGVEGRIEPEEKWEIAPGRQNLLAVFLIFLITIPMLTKIFTSDFGTPIAIGRHIWEHREIAPGIPQLHRAGDDELFPRVGIQAILYGVYSAGGALASRSSAGWSAAASSS